MQFVQEMFARIAPRYDLMNRLMTLGQDIRWRKIVVNYAQVQTGDWILDAGAGTGDLAFEVLVSHPGVQVVAGDFTLPMMLAGKSGPGRAEIYWNGIDAHRMPYEDHTFNAVISGFLMRNVIDPEMALQEQFRVLAQGGRIVILDTTRPRRNIFTPLIRFHMHRVIPWLGRLLTGDREAYLYLPQSSEAFLSAEELAETMIEVGFSSVSFKRLNFGTIAIHSGVK